MKKNKFTKKTIIIIIIVAILIGVLKFFGIRQFYIQIPILLLLYWIILKITNNIKK